MAEANWTVWRKSLLHEKRMVDGHALLFAWRKALSFLCKKHRASTTGRRTKFHAILLPIELWRLVVFNIRLRPDMFCCAEVQKSTPADCGRFRWQRAKGTSASFGEGDLVWSLKASTRQHELFTEAHIRLDPHHKKRHSTFLIARRRLCMWACKERKSAAGCVPNSMTWLVAHGTRHTMSVHSPPPALRVWPCQRSSALARIHECTIMAL